MRVINAFGLVLVTVITVWFAGCSTTRTEPVYVDVPGASTPVATAREGQAPVPEAVSRTTAAPQPETTSEPEMGAAAPGAAVDEAPDLKPELIVTPDNSLAGQVVSVNEVGRFVVLRFPVGRMPVQGAKLFAYRQGLKVAELTVTGPQKDDHTVADVRTGACRVNDQVRDR